jgi:hypothetical protein
MTDTTKPEALRLAEQLETFHPNTLQNKCAAELRRLHAENEALRATLRSIGKYTGEGPSTTPWQDIVRDIGEQARAAMKGQP